VFVADRQIGTGLVKAEKKSTVMSEKERFASQQG